MRSKTLGRIIYSIIYVNVFSVFICLSFICGNANAQSGGKIKDTSREAAISSKVREEMQWMQENLILTIEQYDKLNIISDHYVRQADSLDRITDKQVRDSKKSICSQKKDAEIKAVLNKDQYKTYITQRGKKRPASKSPFEKIY